MIGTHRVEGYAIVSADGMIADAAGTMPNAIRNNADQTFLQTGLDRAGLIVLGRHSNEGGPRAEGRKRLTLTRSVAGTAADPSHPNAFLWNPADVPIDQALAKVGAFDGPIAVIGGTQVFGLFLPLYDTFHLTHAANAKIPGGRPVFPQVGGEMTPEQVLAGYGLRPSPRRDIDAPAGITLTTWERQ
jgi:dihydrofolate reductase